MKTRAIPERLRPTALRVARHEAGHWVITRVHGFQAGDFTATIFNEMGGYRGGAGITLAKPLATLSDIVLYLQQRIRVLYAGGLAESLNQSGKVDQNVAVQCVRATAQDDHTKVRELANILRNVTREHDKSHEDFDAQLKQIDLEMWTAATADVEAEHAVIREVARLFADALLGVNLGCEARLSAAEINVLPAIKQRFGC